ncbi:MAG: glyoxalase, partial [Mycobacterium sp.]|nr:glyoxalase [Mycobacterium sp.]
MKIACAHLWVHDQEVSLKFCTEKVGMEVRED